MRCGEIREAQDAVSGGTVSFAFGLLLIIYLRVFVLSNGGIGPPSANTRRIAFIICTVLALLALGSWLLGLDTLPLTIVAYAPAYQLELYARIARSFRGRHGRDLQLIAFRIVAEPERYQDARYPRVYFVGAVILGTGPGPHQRA